MGYLNRVCRRDDFGVRIAVERGCLLAQLILLPTLSTQPSAAQVVSVGVEPGC